MLKNFTVTALLSATLATLALPAAAESQSATFRVSATVVNSCTIAAQDINFGTLAMPAIGNADAEGAVSVACTINLPYTVTVTSADGNTGAPKMKNGAGTSTITYNLYNNNARTTLISNGANGGQPFTGVGTGASVTYPVYARLNLNQPAMAGAHANTQVVTIVY